MTQTTFLMLLHEDPAATAHLSGDALNALVQRYTAWAEEQAAAGRLTGGDKLTDDGGRHLREVDGRIQVLDGPYAEAKEVIGGFFLLQAADRAEAEAVAATCPHLALGWIELRQIAPAQP